MAERVSDPRLVTVLDLTTPLARVFQAEGYHLYFVGGVVRDSLLDLDRADNDLDATTEARPDRIKELVADMADAVWSQGERFGTIGCRINGRIYEITTHRAETYRPGSRKPVVEFGDRLDDDLSRRDFTINAMAVDVLERRLIDLFGGESDLRDRVLRTPLDPTVSFSDDPLRMLRAARFRARYDLIPVPELTEAITHMADRMSIVSDERIRMELEKLLLLPDPGPGLELLRATGLMTRVLPALAPLDSEALARRAVRVAAVDQSAPQRWAALFEDPVVARRRLRELKAAGSLIHDTETMLRSGQALESVDPAHDADLRRVAAMGGGRVPLENILDWKRRMAEATGESTERLRLIGANLRRLRSAEPDLDAPSVGLDGNHICAALGIEPGVDVGKAMVWLRELRLMEGPLTTDELTSRLVTWWSESRDD